MAPQITQNYFLGFEYGIWLTSMVGPTIIGNAFEGIYKTPIVLTNQLASGATQDGAGATGFTIEGNTFINWAASAADFPAIQLNAARGGFVGPNAYQSPNGAATTIINYRDGRPPRADEGQHPGGAGSDRKRQRQALSTEQRHPRQEFRAE